MNDMYPLQGDSVRYLMNRQRNGVHLYSFPTAFVSWKRMSPLWVPLKRPVERATRVRD